MLVIPQGGCERRFGTEFVDQINDHAMSPVYLTDYTMVKPYIFDYQDGSRYLLIFRENAIDVYLDMVYQSTTTTTYAASEIADLSIAQSANIVFIAHDAHSPATLVRASTGPIVLTLNATPTFGEYPTFDFTQQYDAFTFSVRKAATATPITTTENVLGYVCNIQVSSAMFTADYVGGLFFGEGGVIRITAFNSTTNVAGRIINTFDTESALFTSPNTILGSDAVVTEKAFSTNRGWPQKVAFFQNRLFFGRTTSLLGGIWGSNYNGYTAGKFNFDDSEALDTNAISTIVQGNRATLIQHMVGFKTLLVFTTSGLYSTPLLIDLPLTPSNISFLNLQTSDASNDVVPVVFDNDVIFFDKGGRKVKNVNVYATTQHYESKVISVLAPQLVNTPYSAAVFENSSVKDGNWMFMVNSAGDIEGGLSIYQSVPEQDITAWSLSTPASTSDATLGQGYFRHVVSDEETAFFIVERYVNGHKRLFIEQLSFDAYMDASTIGTMALGTTISGLDELEGETVVVRGQVENSDGMSIVGTTGPVTGGVVTLAEAVTDYEVGLVWFPEIVPMPMNIPLPQGNSLYFPKTIRNIYVDFFESKNIRVDGTLIPPFRIDDDTYNNPASAKTDFVQFQTMSGWNPTAEITISQFEPLPFTLIGIGFVVSI